MLPEKYFIDDQKWIASQVKQIPVELWESAAENYTAVFVDAYAKENGSDLLKLQAARTTANTRLRLYVKRVLEKLSTKQNR